MRVLLPHISRIYPVSIKPLTGKIVLWTIITVFLSINGYFMVTRQKPFNLFRLAILTSPANSNNYTLLANQLWNTNQPFAASEQFLLAYESSSNVLGASTSPLILLSVLLEHQKTLLQNYSHWKQVINEKPDYRDAYITLAVLAYNLRRYDEAISYIDQALTLDPNYQQAQLFQKELKQ